MKILNLVDQDKSDIKYKPLKFPDAQQNITILERPLTTKYGSIVMEVDSVQIKSRLNNFLDLELIVCAVASLRNLGVKEIHLYTPYFLGSRSDRQFEEGSNNYLKDVICPIINSLNFESVTVLDPHSHVLEACLKSYKKIDNTKLVNFAIRGNIKPKDPSNDIILVSPDAGASHKIYKLAESIGYKGDIITCSKERDSEGKLTKCVIPSNAFNKLPEKDYIIIDDICDGGSTFINIAKELKRYAPFNKIYLIVTHGIFSKGFKELSEYFDGIYCTNSYSDILPGKEWHYLHKDEALAQKIVKQLDIFK